MDSRRIIFEQPRVDDRHHIAISHPAYVYSGSAGKEMRTASAGDGVGIKCGGGLVYVGGRISRRAVCIVLVEWRAMLSAGEGRGS